MGRKRKIINVQTLQIYDSLKEASKFFNCSKVDIHHKCMNRDWTRPFFKTRSKGKEVAFLDEWLEYPDEEKKMLCCWSNVDFFSNFN